MPVLVNKIFLRLGRGWLGLGKLMASAFRRGNIAWPKKKRADAFLIQFRGLLVCIHTYVLTHSYVLLYAFIHMYSCMHSYLYTCMYSYLYVLLYAFILICTLVCFHTIYFFYCKIKVFLELICMHRRFRRFTFWRHDHFLLLTLTI